MSEDIISYLRRVPTGFVTDALGRLALAGWMDYVLPLQTEGRVAGRAFTVQYAPRRGTSQCRDNLYSIIRRARPGDILVIEALGTDCWILGENVVHAAKYQELGGIVLDGRVRDAAEIREMDIPVFCRGAAVRPHMTSLELADFDVPICCGGALVRPGDVVVGDADGVVVIPYERLEEVRVQIEDLEILEKEQAAAIAQREPLEVLNDILGRKKKARS